MPFKQNAQKELQNLLTVRGFEFISRGVRAVLGTFGSSAYQSSEQFQSASDYLLYLFSNSQGFHTRDLKREKFIERFFRLDKLIEQQYFGVDDCYCSLNSFFSPRRKDNSKSGRKVDNVKHLNALYVDIDCYNKEYTPDQVLMQLQDDYFGHSIPQPTFAIHSGRGLYLIWRIDEDRNALPRWKAVQRYLFNVLQPFGADEKALDAARVLRVPTTRNSKSGTMVRVMDFCDVSYTLHELISEFDIADEYGKATAPQQRTAKMLATHYQLELPDFDNFEETYNFIARYLPLYNAEHNTTADAVKRGKVAKFFNVDALKATDALVAGRIRDLHRLFSRIRKGADCCREQALFLCRMWMLDATQDADAALKAALDLNAVMDCPFDTEYVTKTTASAEKKWRSGETYRYSIKGIINALCLTDAEQAQMAYLRHNGSSDATERKHRSNRLAYLAKLAAGGRTTKAEAVAERRTKMKKMLHLGMSAEQICKTLGISARTFARDKSALMPQDEATATCARAQAPVQRKFVLQAIRAFITVLLAKSKKIAHKYRPACALRLALPKIQPFNYMGELAPAGLCVPHSHFPRRLWAVFLHLAL